MRAIVVELPGPTLALPPVVEGAAVTVIDVPAGPVSRGEGSLRPRPVDRTRPVDPGADDGEPV
jgi:hypothetical protein